MHVACRFPATNDNLGLEEDEEAWSLQSNRPESNLSNIETVTSSEAAKASSRAGGSDDRYDLQNPIVTSSLCKLHKK